MHVSFYMNNDNAKNTHKNLRVFLGSLDKLSFHSGKYFSECELISEICIKFIYLYTYLFHGITVTHSYSTVIL